MDNNDLKQMADYIANRMLATMSNECYHDFSASAKEDFEIAQLKYFRPAILKAVDSYKQALDDEADYLKRNDGINLLQTNLNRWKEERHLTIESQQKGLLANILEELTELARAKDDNERIDALCDICVFAFNAIPLDIDIAYKNSIYIYDIRIHQELIKFSNHVVSCLKYDDNEEIIRCCFDRMKDLGYDPILCMRETIKEISSRTGHYDDSIGKFIKDEGYYSLNEATLANPKCVVTRSGDKYRIESQTKDIRYANVWEKANYKKCKIS